jgi:hypothetical protein
MTTTDTRPSVRTGIGRVELAPEAIPPAVRSRFRANLAGCWHLVLSVVLIQAADVITTYIGLAAGYVEENGLLRPLIGSSPIGTTALKLGAVLAVVSLALFRLPLTRARVAVGLALALSLIGPLLNLATLLGR